MKTIRFEHWISDTSDTFMGEGPSDCFGDVNNPTDLHPCKEPGGRLCCVIEGISPNDAMRKYHEHMGWDSYKPMLREDGTPYPEDEGIE